MREACPDPELIARAGQIIREGGLVAFPTETVYGLGGDAMQPDSSRKIYEAKGRPSDNPLIVHICEIEALEGVADRIPEKAYRLAERFWPGPLTMIFYKKPCVPYETTGGLDTVAVRFPSNKIAQALIRAGGGYIAAPSANRSGRPSPTLASHCKEDLDGLVDMIIDGGQVGIGLESTIIDLTEKEPVILRPGYITQQMLSEVLGEVRTDRALIDPDSGTKPKAPGMKYRHYAPKAEMTIVKGESGAVLSYINARLDALRAVNKRTGVICTDETAPLYRADFVHSLGREGDEESAARELFRMLRRCDDENVQYIYSEAFPQEGLGQAIMNRMAIAAGQRIIEV